MALPQHNFLLRWIYIVCIIGMFIFMSMVIRGYWVQEADSIKAENYEFNKNVSVEATMSSSVASKKAIPFNGMVSRPTINVTGKNFSLNLDQPIEEQISGFWQVLFTDTGFTNSNKILDNKTVYQVYHHYDLQTNTVDVLLGFAIDDSATNTAYRIIKLPAAIMLPRKSVLESWQNSEYLPIKLSYELDYEIFRLNNNFETLSQKAFLNGQ